MTISVYTMFMLEKQQDEVFCSYPHISNYFTFYKSIFSIQHYISHAFVSVHSYNTHMKQFKITNQNKNKQKKIIVTISRMPMFWTDLKGK